MLANLYKTIAVATTPTTVSRGKAKVTDPGANSILFTYRTSE